MADIYPGSGNRVMNPPIGEYFPEEYDCECEEGGYEALVNEARAKPAPSRNPSKRSRPSEVHDLSEKKRRSRINEKMKALQNLIPNSNKTDKASMLDEAIEYLKQLQLQVQMSTMRNGLSLYPMCKHPTQPSQMNMGFLEGNGPLNISLTPPVAQGTSTSEPNQSTDPAHLQGPGISSVIRPGMSLGLGSSVQGPIVLTQLHISSMEADIFREVECLDSDHFQTNLLGVEMVDNASKTPISCETQLSHREDDAFEACVLRLQSPQACAPEEHSTAISTMKC